MVMHKLFALSILIVCSGCGSANVQSQLPQTDGTSTLSDFTLLTYNVQSRPLLDAARAKENLPLIGQRLNEFDIAGIQECFSFSDLLLNQTNHPSRYYFEKRASWWSVANSGLASVSRFLLLAVKTCYYQSKAELPDQIASKGILLTRYDISGKIIDVYNTHMQAGHSDDAQRAREHQAEQLSQFVEENSPADRAIILHGDFNMGPARPGKSLEAFTPRHYTTATDMTARTAVFSTLMHRLQVKDVSDELFGPTLDHIDRVLFRSSEDLRLVPLSWKNKTASFRDARGAPLSDSTPVAVRFGYVVR